MRPLACLVKPKPRDIFFITSVKRKSCALVTTLNEEKIQPSTTRSFSSKNTSSALPKEGEAYSEGENYVFNHTNGPEPLNSGTSKFTDKQIEKGIRKNEFNIQMLSEDLYQHIFGKYDQQKPPDPELIHEAQKKLKEHGLWKEDIQFLKNVSLKLPPLKGKNIEEHFRIIGSEQSEPYRELVSSFIQNGIPECPTEWLCHKGWMKYEPGKEPVPVEFPEEDVLVLDVEVCLQLGGIPTLATAVSGSAWYGWVCSDLADGKDPLRKNFFSPDMLISLEGETISSKRPRVVIGYNASYDRARVKEQYNLKSSALKFLDTMSLHTCIGGFSNRQKAIIKKSKSNNCGSENEQAFSCYSSLKETYKLYCNKNLSKETRNIFVENSLVEIRKEFQKVMAYCSNDVKATFEVLQVVFPLFLKRFPHPVTLAGMLEMGSPILPVNNNWTKFIADTDQTYEDLKNEVSTILLRKSDNACKLLHNEAYKNCLWMWSEDWSVQNLKLTKKKLKPQDKAETSNANQETENEIGDEEEKELEKKFQYLFDLKQILPQKKVFLPGYPNWYRKIYQKVGALKGPYSSQLSSSLYITPKLLKLKWENFPMHHTAQHGWGILVADIFADKPETEVPFQPLKELTLKNCNIDLNDESSLKNLKIKSRVKKSNPLQYYTGSGIWCNHVIDKCSYFFKLPHKNGSSFNVGNPLSKDFVQLFSQGFSSGLDSTAERVMDICNKISYWRNNRERILGQMVVWLHRNDLYNSNEYSDEVPLGAIIPCVIVCGTMTRRAMESTWLTASKVNRNRIGSELRSMIQAPPGYHFVGADVDSQELWIASLIGDSNLTKIHGSTPFGWMTLYGTKSNETDLHSMTAKAVGISREHAKTLNYARIYGAGVKFAGKLLHQFNPTINSQEAVEKATKIYNLTKGQKVFKVKNSFVREFQRIFGVREELCNLSQAIEFAKICKKSLFEICDKYHWVGGTESDMFNKLEQIANSWEPRTPFLESRMSRALEPKYQGDKFFLTSRINWVVQSGAVDFLHLMLVCMKWLTNGHARYTFSFHDEVRFLVPSEEKYNAALALHITNLLVRCFCSHRLGMYDLPQSVAFFSSVEVDKSLRKDSDDDCITPSNPHGVDKDYGIPPGESLDIYQVIEKSGGSLSPFDTEIQVFLYLH